MAQSVEQDDNNSSKCKTQNKTTNDENGVSTTYKAQDNFSSDNKQDDNSSRISEGSLFRFAKEAMKTALIFLSHLTLSVLSHPGGVIKEELSAEISGPPPLVSFDKGGIGVNFLGYHAQAGLGGLLTGNAADGGLHAEAGTPHGQYAGAGLGGTVGEGRAAGGLYAGATAGGGVSASAGLGGSTQAEGSSGGLYAGSAAAGIGKSVELSGTSNVQHIGIIKEKTVVPAAPVIKEKVVHVASAPTHAASFNSGIYLSKNVNLQPAVEIEEVVEEKPVPQKTYVERTVIPNYVEKTIHVPSYVEKTVRVPTVIEKKVQVPAPPTIIEKEVAAPPVTNVEIQKTKTVYRPVLRKQWRKYGSGNFGIASRFAAAGALPPPPPPPPLAFGSSSFSVQKQFNGNLFDDIFNIPISTLHAVNRLVGGVAGGTSASFSASKHFNTYK